MIDLNVLHDDVHPGPEIRKGMVDFGNANGGIWSFGYLLKEGMLGLGFLHADSVVFDEELFAVVGVR